MDQLLDALRAAGLLDEQGKIVLERYPNGGCQCVDPETFASLFGSVLDDPEVEDTYDALVAADADPGTGRPRGYSRFFRAWRAAGII